VSSGASQRITEEGPACPAAIGPSAACRRPGLPAKAVALGTVANKSNDPFVRAELESLTTVYMRLAEETEQMAAPPESGEDTIKP